MTPDWYEKSRQNHVEFLKRANAKGRLETKDEIRRFLVLAISGEAGELANMYKKEWRGADIDQKVFDHEARMEAADIYTYLIHYSRHMGFDLDEAAAEKVEIVRQKLEDSK